MMEITIQDGRRGSIPNLPMESGGSGGGPLLAGGVPCAGGRKDAVRQVIQVDLHA